MENMTIGLDMNNLGQMNNDKIVELTGFDINAFTEIVELQDKFNTQVIGSDWKKTDTDWKMAIMLENGELLDSFDWKWWKAGITDWENIEIEMVDLFHFLIAIGSKEEITKAYHNFFIAQELVYKEKTVELNKETEKIIIDKMLNTFNSSMINGLTLSAASIFIEVWYMMGKTSDDLFRKYKMKYALNNFRQANGYKDGSYVKIWKDDKEDNVFAQELQVEIPNDSDYIDNLYKALELKYNSITKTKKVEVNLVDFIKSSDQYVALIENIPNEAQKIIFEMMELYRATK